jgi:hypothetical protein
MITIEEFNSYNLTKKARIAIEQGNYVGETYDDLSVYGLYKFWVLIDEDLNVPSNIPSYTAVKMAKAVTEKPLINPSTDPDNEIKIG